MSRLADYFVVVGYDHEKERSGSRCGKILQRFPEKDWPDTPFIESIELFCQPLGWELSTERQEPQFFVSVLTDIDAKRHYCACLSFNETVAITPSKPVDEEEENLGVGRIISSGPAAITHHSIMYAPKCLVLMSRLNYTETFRNCLGTIYTVYIESLSFPLESLVGNILGCIQVPPPGGPQVRFSIGANDKQALQPPLSNTLPVTGTCVHSLFQQLGIKNVLLLFCAVMTEHKILFHSSSYSRLTESCHALTALMYPFVYSHVYIPILPASLIEVLSTPTPFIMGVHSSLQHDINDVLDVLIADLDGGSIYIPESLVPPVAKLPSALWKSTQEALQRVLQPELAAADLAFPLSGSEHKKQPFVLDKEIRAVFMRLFAQLLQGYRSCLTLIRIYPKPVIKFHKAGFLGARDMIDCDFLSRLLDSMYFSEFVSERGAPWRPCDAWDELYSSMNELLKTESQDSKLVLSHIQEIASQLCSNENPNPQVYPQKILRPPDGAVSRIHQPPMPRIDGEVVQEIIRQGMSRNDVQARLASYQPRLTPRIVPMGCHLQSILDGRPIVNNTARRLEVLKTCIKCVFENKIADARKSFPAVMRILKQRDARLTLCRELASNVQGNKAVLDNQQFDLVVKLMNRALQDDSAIDEYGVAAALIPLSTAFCRKLCMGVFQFAYSCIQDHPVWKNQSFWEMSFYQDVQSEIKKFYLGRTAEESSSQRTSYSWAGESTHPSLTLQKKDFRTSLVPRLHPEPLALEIAAEQMRLWPSLEETKRKELVDSEEQTVFSQAMHYASLMVSLLLPLDVNSTGRVQKVHGNHMDDTASISNSVIESRSQSGHSDEGFEETDPKEVGNEAIKMVSKFIDRICTEGMVTPVHLQSLHNIVPGLVYMQIETLETVCRESKRIPPIQKPKIHRPNLLPGEDFIGDPMRSYLLADGREEAFDSPLFPAEGALFLTNYRVIFRGSPCDALACEHSIVRAFPISSLTKEKRISVLYLKHLEQMLPEGLQLRSSTFQLIKVAFDEEVTVETIEAFRKQIMRVRNPVDEFGYFAFASHGMTIPAQYSKVAKEKNATLKNIAKRTLMRTAKKAGFKTKTKSQKYVLPGFNDVDDEGGNEDEEGNSDENADSIPRHVTVKDVERLKERGYVKDWLRLGLGDPQSGYRITTSNCNYSLCRSLPAILCCPKDVSDESVRNLAKCYKGQRIPVPTWRHQNGAVLLRGAVPLAKGVIGMLKGHPSSTPVDGPNSSYQEQDWYFVRVIDTTPVSRSLRHTWGLSDSNASIDSLAMAANNVRIPSTSSGMNAVTPDSNRRNIMSMYGGSSSSFGNMRSSQKTTKWNSLKPSPAPLRDINNWDHSASNSSQTFRRVPLYFLGEKSQSRSVKLSEMCAEFIPIDYTDVRHSRIAFKKLMRACLPSVPNTEPDQTFAKQVEQSEWLQQIRGLLQLSGAVVDLIDLQESSVCLAIEDGWDCTAQLSSLAQLCLDPFYRTIEGFRVLIEKEWLAFGHRFGHRSNLKPSSSRSGSIFAPTFLQFLDAVFQIHLQFPLAFEFNEFYLRFLAYHSVSCRFRTFLFDSELERVCSGITAVDDKRGSLNSHHKTVVDTCTGSDDDSIYPGGVPRSSSSGAQKLGSSIFDYIERHNTKSPIFFNFMFTPDPERQVLRPQSALSTLEIWPFYVSEELAHGPPYDPELTSQDLYDEDEDGDYGGVSLERNRPVRRKVVMAGYDNLDKFDPDAFSILLESLKQAESERNLLPQKWRQVWDKLELPHSDSLTRHASFSSALVRSQTRLQHKRSTLEIIMRGRLSGAHQESFSHPHRFEKQAFTTPTHCNHCGSLLWGPVRNGLRCMDCGNSYHEKCADSVPKNCTKYKAVEGPPQTIARNQGDNGSVSSSANTAGQTSNQDIYNKFGSNVGENKTHEGYLFKRGALLKGWKQRYFVLDSIKHQIRYFDSGDDQNPKGFIDLAEVQTVVPAQASGPLPSKNADEHAFFDLKTSKRTYYFYALDEQKAREWIDKIQACLQ